MGKIRLIYNIFPYPNKIPKDLQKLILQRSANQERETAKKLLNKNGYYSPESNTKDW